MDPQSVGPHAFLSYVHEDTTKVDRLEAFLKEAGVQVWRDLRELLPGDNWKVRIREAIVENSLAFIVCFSEHSVARKTTHQNEELRLATEHYRRRPPDLPWLFPIRFADCKIPQFELDATTTLASIHHVDLLGDMATWDEPLTKLLKGLQRTFPDLGHQRAPTRPSAESGPRTPQPGRRATTARPPIAVQGHPLSIRQPSNVHTPAGKTTDIVMRSAVVLPSCRHLPAHGDGVLSLVTGTRRETAIANLLDQCELTEWLARQAEAFHLEEIPGWSPHGHNAGDNTHLVLVPPDDEGNPGPLAAICQINTGWVAPAGEHERVQPGLEITTDLAIRVLEYDSERRPSRTRHATTPPPAPAAVSLEFLFAGIVALLDTARVATAVWPALLGADPPTTGDLMCWFTTQGPGLNQLVDLTGIRSISGSGGSGAHQRIQEDLPLGGDTDAMAPLEVRRFVAYGILSEALEHSGYRDDDSRLDAIRDDPGRC